MKKTARRHFYIIRETQNTATDYAYFTRCTMQKMTFSNAIS